MATRSHPVHCTTTPLCEAAVGSVSFCPGCGVVHLQLQYLTLRFEPDAFLELARLVGEARLRLGMATAAAIDPATEMPHRDWH